MTLINPTMGENIYLDEKVRISHKTERVKSRPEFNLSSGGRFVTVCETLKRTLIYSYSLLIGH